MRGYGPSELLASWRTGRDRHGVLLNDEGFASLCKHLTRELGAMPDGECGTGEPLTAKEQANRQREDEMSAIPDTDFLTRAEAAKLIGISVASLDRYVRRGEAIGGIAIEPRRASERNVRYLASDVKAVRSGIADQVAANRAERIRQQESGEPPSVVRSTAFPAVTKPGKKR